MSFFLPHHDAHARVLVGDRLDALTEQARDQLGPDVVEHRAFWVDPEGEPVILVATEHGPTLMIGSKRHLLRDFSVEIARIDEDRRICIIRVGGEPVATIEYLQAPFAGGWWEEGDLGDFFAWLAKNANDPNFGPFWTVPLPTGAVA